MQLVIPANCFGIAQKQRHRMKRKSTIRKQKIGENLIYSAVWTVVYLIPIMNAKLMSELHVDFNNVLTAWIKTTPFFLLFLVHNQLLARLLISKKRHIITYLLTSIVLLGLTFALIDVYERSNLAVGDSANLIEARHASLTDLEWYWNIMLGLFMFGMNIGIKMLYKSMQDDEDMERLKRQTIQAELYYLKYQINPHFFMNTLNNIHALIDIDTEMAKQCLIELSAMMRYVVYDSGTESISMKKDMTFIENYIELMRIRYAQEVDIRFNYPHNLSGKVVIPPLIFIVFVENAFKHGISYNHPSYIHIDIKYDGKGSVTAHFENSVHTPQQPHKTGIGLENVQRRLDLIYGNKYSLQIDDSTADKYCVTITIPTINNDKMLGN